MDCVTVHENKTVRKRGQGNSMTVHLLILDVELLDLLITLLD